MSASQSAGGPVSSRRPTTPSSGSPCQIVRPIPTRFRTISPGNGEDGVGTAQEGIGALDPVALPENSTCR